MHPHNECTISSYTFSGTVVFSIERDKFWERGARFQKEKDDKPWLRKSIPAGWGRLFKKCIESEVNST